MEIWDKIKKEYDSLNERDKIRVQIKFNRLFKVDNEKRQIELAKNRFEIARSFMQIKDELNLIKIMEMCGGAETVRLLALGANRGDSVCSEMIKEVPSPYQHCGLYPETIEKFDILPESVETSCMSQNSN